MTDLLSSLCKPFSKGAVQTSAHCISCLAQDSTRALFGKWLDVITTLSFPGETLKPCNLSAQYQPDKPNKLIYAEVLVGKAEIQALKKW